MALTRGHKAETGIMSADTLVKSVEGYVFSLTLAFRGVSAGEFCTLIDGTVATGSDEVMIVYAAANGTFHFIWPEGKHFGTGIFFNKGATTGHVFASLTYK